MKDRSRPYARWAHHDEQRRRVRRLRYAQVALILAPALFPLVRWLWP